MIRTELVTRSPLRILERSTHGGVGKGNIGVIAGIKGVGKTACLVHIATDDLFQGRHVLHISFASETGHIVAWYEDIFNEIARRHNLDNAAEIHDETVRNRVIINFRQDGVHWAQIEERIKTLMSAGNFSADALIIDGFDFKSASIEEIKGIRAFAKSVGLEIWFSVSVAEQIPADAADKTPAVLKPFIQELAIVIILVDNGPFISLELIKDHDVISCTDLHLKLDPQILLIAEQ